MTTPPMTPMQNPANDPLAAMHAPFRLVGPTCKECGAALGKTFHVVDSVAKCEACFRADVAKLNQSL